MTKEKPIEDTEDGLSYLREIPAFDRLADDVLMPLVDGAEHVAVSPESFVFRQGDSPDTVFVLVEGQIALETALRDSSTAIIDILAPTDILQLASVLTGTSFTVSARALSRARLLALSGERLRSLAETDPTVALSAFVSLAHHQDRMLQQIKDLKLRSAAQRLACFILRLRRQQNNPERIKLPFDKQFLAGRLGTTPENLSRAFATLRNHGVQTSGSQVMVLAPERLAEFAICED